MNDTYIYAVGLSTSGMSTWIEGAAILRGDKRYEKTEMPVFTPSLQRLDNGAHSTTLIKLALQVAEQAVERSSLSSSNLGSVFACSAGDSEVIDKICEALTLAERSISPTDFHHLLHNAPGACWSILNSNCSPSTTLSADCGSFAGGLLEAAGLSVEQQCPTLFVCYDLQAPDALQSVIPIKQWFGCALLLGNVAIEHSLAKIHLELAGATETTLTDSTLESLRLSNPAARSLPLLKAIAGNQTQTVVLPYLDDLYLSVTCSPY